MTPEQENQMLKDIEKISDLIEFLDGEMSRAVDFVMESEEFTADSPEFKSAVELRAKSLHLRMLFTSVKKRLGEIIIGA